MMQFLNSKCKQDLCCADVNSVLDNLKTDSLFAVMLNFEE